MKTLQCDDSRVLVRLLRTSFEEGSEHLNSARHKVVRLKKSVYVFSCRGPSLTDLVNNGFAVFIDNSWREVQRAGASQSFYGSSEGKYFTVLVFREMQESGTENSCSLGQISVWCGKALSFLIDALDALEKRVLSEASKIELLEMCLRHKKGALLHLVVRSRE